MNGHDAPPMACGVCGLPLNRHHDLDTGETRFIHPLGRRTQVPNHQPVPVLAAQMDPLQVCDFCTDESTVYVFETDVVQAVLLAGGDRLVQHYGTRWLACATCATFIATGDARGLRQRALGRAPVPGEIARQTAEVLLDTVLGSLRPGRELAIGARWQPVPLSAATLPKTRDGLTRLLRGDDRLPLGLDPDDIRRQLARGLDTARLYWIDEEFTELARHAVQSLPPTAITDAGPPAPDGMIAWAQPVGHHTNLTAATWTSTPDGVRLVCYRSIGAGLAPTQLQWVRKQIGWLIPAHHSYVRRNETLEPDDPVAIVAVTWLLIAQKLAEAVPVAVDKAIRKSYQRAGRPAPQVRLIRIHGNTSPGADDTTKRASVGEATGKEHQYRWWVRGHWRNQPYGPGRERRRLIYIDPHTRGPQDKPIRIDTTVRVLGTIHTPPRDTAPRQS